MRHELEACPVQCPYCWQSFDLLDIKRQEKNLSIATGKGLRKGAFATISIEWTYGNEVQPDVKVHLTHIEAWLR